MLITLWHALEIAFLMAWEIFWALALGFGLSAIVQALIPKGQMSKLLPDASFKSLITACGLGAVSSSCSYAAVALTRSIIVKGANFIAAMGFQLASTNLVAEIGIVMILLLGWQFMLADFAGGILMVYLMAILFKRWVSPYLIKSAILHAEQGRSGKMEAHAKMDMSLTEGTFFSRLLSDKGFTAVSHYYFMDWHAVWKDIVLGLLIAGLLATTVPNSFWNAFFLQSHPTLAILWGPLIGPIIAIFSFVCSVGNVPLAAVLWNGGISFGGVIAFIFADLLVLPILDIYRKYYGYKMMIAIFLVYYIAMACSALIIELLFQFFHLIPAKRSAQIVEMSMQFNYTSVLNMIFAVISITLLYRFIKTKGIAMLRMMK